jgi:hypothetical protein
VSLVQTVVRKRLLPTTLVIVRMNFESRSENAENGGYADFVRLG